jgi:NAD(P)H-dependent FMN reductase
MDKLKVAVIEGTKRVQRRSIMVANLVVAEANKLPELSAELIDPVSLSLPGEGYLPGFFDQHYRDVVAAADALIIVTPEYNHSYPSSLKRMLDSANKEYKHKPAGIIGVSDGPWGGVRAIEALLPPLRALAMVPIVRDVHFPRVPELFNEDGSFKEAEAYKPRFEKFFAELIWMAKTLKSGREQNG